METNAEEKIYQKAMIVGLRLPEDDDFDDSLEELRALCEAVYITPVLTIIQSLPKPIGSTFVGKGKLQEIKEESSSCEIIIFLQELTPIQLKNISDEVNVPVIDRTMLILKIFQVRAKTKEAKLQVEIANLRYMLPRLIGLHTDLSKIGGSSSNATRGAGEKKLELDRRILESQIDRSKLELKEVVKNRQVARKMRLSSNIPSISFVGYTNAGKSSTINTLLSMYGGQNYKQEFVKDMLFATLETTTRKITLPNNHEFLLTDTVGFVKDLPHSLVDSFRSTLEEITESDYIVNVIDASSKEMKKQVETTQKVLKEIGVKDIPILYVFNKQDLVEDTVLIDTTNYKPSLIISNKTKEGIDELVNLLDKSLYTSLVKKTYLFPFESLNIFNELKQKEHIISIGYLDAGIEVTCEIPTSKSERLMVYEKHN